jgi:hypothetical protein
MTEQGRQVMMVQEEKVRKNKMKIEGGNRGYE